MKLQHSIEITGSREEVWQVTKDVENWPNWTPTVENIVRLKQTPLKVGSQVMIKQPKLPETIWTISKYIPGEVFQWKAILRGMKTTATHKITSTGDVCINTLILEMEGLLASLLWPLIRNQLKKALELENTGLKNFCENSVVQSTM